MDHQTIQKPVEELRAGSFFVFEGLDRCGKSTQAKLLVEYLESLGHKVELIKFPNRTTETGKLIDQYLKKEIEFTPMELEKLFADNKFEQQPQIKDWLKAGTMVVCDRYIDSALAYGEANGTDPEIIKQLHKGLVNPDVTFYLDVPCEDLIKRPGFGDERYERKDFLERVQTNFKKLTGKVILRTGSIEEVSAECRKVYDFFFKEAEEMEGECPPLSLFGLSTFPC